MPIHAFLVAASVASIIAATNAAAQEASQPTPSLAGNTAAAQSALNSGDIVVTARRREENLQDVPISVSALSGAALERTNVKNAVDLQFQTPSLTVSTTGQDRGSLAFGLRGQRSNESQLLTDPPVGTYFGEVVQPRPFGFGRSLYDLQSVQVLKGVQGTLFGRNVTGGAILIEPNHPSDRLEAEVRGQLGNYDLREGYGMVNLPLGDIGGFRIAGVYHNRTGFSTDVGNGRDYDDENYYSVRAGLTLKPVDGVENYTVVDYFKSDEHGTGSFLTGYTPIELDTQGKPVIVNGAPVPTVLGQLEGARQFGGPGGTPLPLSNIPAQFAAAQALQQGGFKLNYGAGTGGRLDAFGQLPYNRQKDLGVTNKTTYKFGDMTLKNILGYRAVDSDRLYDFDGIPAFLINSVQNTHIKQYSEELQLQGDAFDKRLSYTVGGYYFLERGQDGSISSQFPELTLLGFAGAGVPINPFTAPASLALLSQPGFGRAQTYAFYGATTYKLTDKISLAGGLRYTDDKRTAIVSPIRPNLGAPPGTCTFNPTPVAGGETVTQVGPCSFKNQKSWNAVTGDATVSYEPTDALNVYASYRRGFRSGGFSLRAQSALELQSFQPEHVNEYEVGLKTNTRFTGGRLTTSLAGFYQDYTNVQKQNPVLENGQVVTVVTNTAAQENYGLEAEAKLSFAMGFYANVFYSWTKVHVLQGRVPLTYDAVATPEHQLGLTLGYTHEVLQGSTLDLTGNVWYRSDQHLDDKDFAGNEAGYALVNLRAGLSKIAGTGIGVAGFVNNLTDKRYRIGVLGLEDSVGFLTSIYGDPRTYGVELSYKF